MDREAWRATVHGVAKESDMTDRLNNNHKQPKAKEQVQETLGYRMWHFRHSGQ